MSNLIILIQIIFIFAIGCANVVDKTGTFYNPKYKVIDRGSFDVKVISQACSDKFNTALSAAKTNGKFHLRSIVGSKNHRIEFKEIKSYIEGGQICVEISALSSPH